MSLIVWKGPLNALVMQPESGAISGTDRWRGTDVYRCNSGYSFTIPQRGTLGTGSRLGWVVSETSFATERGGIAKYTIQWEAGGPSCGLTPPSPEIKLDPQELYPPAQQNRYFRDQDGNLLIAMLDLTYAQATMHASNQFARDDAYTKLKGRANNPDNNPSASLALDLADILRNGAETFYLAGWRYVVTTYSFSLPSTSPGGFIQVPNPQPNPAYFSTAISWLRLADSLESSGPINSMWKITQTWLGGPMGHWNPILYS